LTNLVNSDSVVIDGGSGEIIKTCRPVKSNQDVVYGGGSLGLEKSPVVIQVPDFGDRFWVYQAVDLRSDGFVQIGKMYGSMPGFYLLTGPNWRGEVPKGITEVFRASTNTGFIAPRIFMDDTDQDRRVIQSLLQQILMYPLAEYDGTMKSIDWSTIPKLPNPATGEQEVLLIRRSTANQETWISEMETYQRSRSEMDC
jgi:hypothetical protein